MSISICIIYCLVCLYRYTFITNDCVFVDEKILPKHVANIHRVCTFNVKTQICHLKIGHDAQFILLQ